jgi:hypothetical protein
VLERIAAYEKHISPEAVEARRLRRNLRSRRHQ